MYVQAKMTVIDDVYAIEEKLRDAINNHDHDQVDMVLMNIEKTVIDGWVDDTSSEGLSIVQSLVTQLEACIESHAYTWDECLPLDESVTWIEAALKCISQLYKIIATSSLDLFKKYSSIKDLELADLLLDWAIASKRANLINDCVEALRLRMQVSPILKELDAVRLLGLDTIGESLAVEEICNQGIFETEMIEKEYGDTSCEVLVPTEVAKTLGTTVNEILDKHAYTLLNCSKMLYCAVNKSASIDTFVKERIFCACTFFNYRNEVLSSFDTLPGDLPLKLLALLFLFGVSVNRNKLELSLGQEAIRVLMDARLLREHPFDSNLVIAEVQIFPLSCDTFNDTSKENSYSLYFITDWIMESLRSPENAVMSVGYDTMELLALSSGVKLSQGGNESNSVLDLCSGCGIQGIYFAKVHELRGSITFMDVNKRACHFITANLCMNTLFSAGEAIQFTTVEADIFQPMKLRDVSSASSKIDIGKFNFILSNPPFVAVPFAKLKSLTPSLYAIGGESDGMGLLRKLLKQVLHRLDETSISKLLMVTEVPNVEDSLDLLHGMLSKEFPCRIRVAYIEQDVETAEEYALERENESGVEIQSRDWHVKHIRNRALVLITIELNSSDKRNCLYCYKEMAEQGLDDADAHYIDDEDLFLTRQGINFARQNLL